MERDKRREPRTALPGPAARAREAREVRLLDLSLQGGRIEHRDLLYPGAPCHRELPAALGSLVLAARVVWSAVIGAERSARGERHLRSRTGLMFDRLTTTQHTALAATLEELTAGRLPA